MFDPESARILRGAPELPGLRSEKLPDLLTKHYAELVSERLRAGGAEVESRVVPNAEWGLSRIADNYEIVAATHSDFEMRKAASFVAATAQQILARRERWMSDVQQPTDFVTRDHVDPKLAAVLLFLAAEQFADAAEAALEIVVGDVSGYSADIARYVRSLGLGRVDLIPSSMQDSLDLPGISIEERALNLLLRELISGVHSIAAFVRSRSPEVEFQQEARRAFDLVADLAGGAGSEADLSIETVGVYPGPRHLAALLRGASAALERAALNQIPPPDDVNLLYWWTWIESRVSVQPYVWPNHRLAVEQGFYKSGTSAVLVLPTGAGKTTVSSLKIAACLAAGKRVVFLAPTHALVEQLVDDLQTIFPTGLIGAEVSSDSDGIFEDAALPHIEVMTPERCLASLCFSPDRFRDVGMLVFDECHLLAPSAGSFRRSLDGMLCVLAFQRVVPGADFLFLSAMLKNGNEFARWIEWLTGRNCLDVSLLWKPSRQARGVVVYDAAEIKSAKEAAIKAQITGNAKAGKPAKQLRAKALEKLRLIPFAIWGLRHNWLNAEKNTASFSRQPLLSKAVTLTGYWSKDGLLLTPNVNVVASQIAADSVKAGLKTIVFVNNKSHSVSTAKAICEQLGNAVGVSEPEGDRWEALEAELGDLKHSVLRRSAVAVPHNASMLRVERDIAERSYRRRDGARVIVATPTLAQGLNLPAQLAILAGDKRTDPDDGGRAELEAHELLNAAARAGRAGHLANGVVLLIPDPVLSTKEQGGLGRDAISKLQAILPEDDRCVYLSDPLEVILDRLTLGDDDNQDVRYAVNRLITFRSGELEQGPALFDVKRSFAAFRSVVASKEQEFDLKVDALLSAVDRAASREVAEPIALMSAKTGLPIGLIERLSSLLANDLDRLPRSVAEWVDWVFSWLSKDEESALELLRAVLGSLNSCVGVAKNVPYTSELLVKVRPGVLAWLMGSPLRDIETALGGEPDSHLSSKVICPRARELVGTLMPRGISYIMSVVVMALDSMDTSRLDDFTFDVMHSLTIATRRGFDTPQKVRFAMKSPVTATRVQIHRAFAEAAAEADGLWPEGY